MVFDEGFFYDPMGGYLLFVSQEAWVNRSRSKTRQRRRRDDDDDYDDDDDDDDD
jgi:hypothetical protein